MSRSALILRVMVASPEDVAEERQLLEQVVHELNVTWSQTFNMRLELVRWETHAYPAMGSDAQAVIDNHLDDDYDVFIGILWTRLGTPTARAPSGTIEEFERAYKRFQESPDSLRIMFYFKNPPVEPSRLDPAQLTGIRNFRERLGAEGGLYWSYNRAEDFSGLVRMHLARQIQEWKRSSEISLTNGTETARDHEAIKQVALTNESSPVDRSDVGRTFSELLTSAAIERMRAAFADVPEEQLERDVAQVIERIRQDRRGDGDVPETRCLSCSTQTPSLLVAWRRPGALWRRSTMRGATDSLM